MKVKLNQILQGGFRKLIWYVGLVLILLMGISIVKNIGKLSKIKSEVEREKQKVEKIKRENEELAKQIAETQGVEFIERQLRDKLGLVKEGEAVVVLPDEETIRKFAPKISEEEDALPDPNWKKWLKLFL